MAKHAPPPRRLPPVVLAAGVAAVLASVGVLGMLAAPVVETPPPLDFPSTRAAEPVARGGLVVPLPPASPVNTILELPRPPVGHACRCTPRRPRLTPVPAAPQNPPPAPVAEPVTTSAPEPPAEEVPVEKPVVDEKPVVEPDPAPVVDEPAPVVDEDLVDDEEADEDPLPVDVDLVVPLPEVVP